MAAVLTIPLPAVEKIKLSSAFASSMSSIVIVDGQPRIHPMVIKDGKSIRQLTM